MTTLDQLRVIRPHHVTAIGTVVGNDPATIPDLIAIIDSLSTEELKPHANTLHNLHLELSEYCCYDYADHDSGGSA